jgi:ATP synthase protein I
MGVKLVGLQGGVVGIMAAAWLMAGWPAAVSALLGGLAVVLPSFYFAYRFFAVTHARQVRRIIRSFYWGEFTKIALSGVLVVLIARCWPDMAALPFFSSFLAASLSVWLVPLIYGAGLK